MGLIAMQKVVGSNPISRLASNPLDAVEPIQRLIRERVPVDAAALGDPEVSLG
jgi:hypothetical protein